MSPLIDGRLPMAVVPQRYDLLLTVEPDRGEFSGSVALHVLVREPVRDITRHALELTVPRAVVEAGGVRFPVHVSVDADSETITLTPDREVPARDREGTRLNASKVKTKYAVLWLKEEKDL